MYVIGSFMQRQYVFLESWYKRISELKLIRALGLAKIDFYYLRNSLRLVHSTALIRQILLLWVGM